MKKMSPEEIKNIRAEEMRKMRESQARGEARRLAQLATQTSEEAERSEEIRNIQIATAKARRSPIVDTNRQLIHLQDEE